jgi:hypothetical protein
MWHQEDMLGSQLQAKTGYPFWRSPDILCSHLHSHVFFNYLSYILYFLFSTPLSESCTLLFALPSTDYPDTYLSFLFGLFHYVDKNARIIVPRPVSVEIPRFNQSRGSIATLRARKPILAARMTNHDDFSHF